MGALKKKQIKKKKLASTGATQPLNSELPTTEEQSPLLLKDDANVSCSAIVNFSRVCSNYITHRFQPSDAKPELVDNQSGVKDETPEVIMKDIQTKNSSSIKKRQTKKKLALVELADHNIETECKTKDEEILPHPTDDSSKQVNDIAINI